jgi:hypothetical protein
VGSADGVSQPHIDGGLIVEQAGGQQWLAGGEQATADLCQFHERALQGVQITQVIHIPAVVAASCPTRSGGASWGSDNLAASSEFSASCRVKGAPTSAPCHWSLPLSSKS